MARYIGPKTKIARKFGEAIFGPDKVLSKKNYPPGQHGNNRRKKTSEYGIQLREKQKAKYTYGVLEKQFHIIYERARRASGVTGVILLQMLESRLDNLVFRMGMAPTRAAARQLVSHKHITVDGKVVNIPSYQVKPGQVVGVREKDKSMEVIQNSLNGFNHSKYPWIEWNASTLSGTYLHIPEREDIPENIKEHLIVELYSK
ncbi:MAG TPA: 30S ribosomal protein S4 [Paludibacteraceae bacterium]|jgi:small subunit ribosomal protein S4|nr:30S ribosomal protein S4 [Paludibacteraceae bacterium]MBP9017279.1 30S ribosomal protein S4 [Paludibacteraceae bacterium]MDS1031228.1 30S ribosomal protein S4 [Porphyromonadaceae sp. NP-X]NLJ20765.1 30S ribosomal protein S4 [Bacteroidales bacterium]HOH55413.1 30S ribosomal protein S4 [Paludibacteraceae bacterium]